MNSKKMTYLSKKAYARHSALAVAVAVGLGLSGQVFAQATTGTIFGQVPVASGESVQVVGGAGYNRTIAVDSQGRYSITLPVGTYTVNLIQNGQVIQSKTNIAPNVASGVEVNFAAAATATAGANVKNLTGLTVTANSLPPIDVSSTRQSMVVTAQQLAALPLARSGEAIALLAPGTVRGQGLLGSGPTGQPLVSFGGSSVVENAYYINGYNTSDPLYNEGGITLPYGSIEQQQTLTSGYGAAYGRSAGGVISQIGKSGSNDWHFGAQAQWRPAFAQGNYVNLHYNNPLSSATGNVGKMQTYKQPNSVWETVYDAYVSGPLIKDKLFFFLSAEADKQQQTANQSVGAGLITKEKYSLPKFYGKLDWNINDSNILSLTGIRNAEHFQPSYYDYDNKAHTTGGFNSYGPQGKNSFKIWSAQYTSYITDNLTFNALYGKMSDTYFTYQPGEGNSQLASISGATEQNPALTGGNPNGIQNSNVNLQIPNTNHTGGNDNLRIDLDWKLGSHDVQFGIDNQNTFDAGDGSVTTGPGYGWVYAQNQPGTYLVGSNPNSAPWVDAPGGYPNGAGGYTVEQYKFFTAASVRVQQRAQYIQDNWQVTNNLLLNLGLRNDQFTNLNADSIPYIRLKNGQLAPRLGFSWDVFGDSSVKVFGNAGRYYLALPTGVAVREASASTYTRSYYTYSGIDPTTGYPTGLTPINSNGETSGPGVPVSLNNEYGKPLNPTVVHSTNIKAEYQDQFVLGMQQQFATSWVYGVQATYQKLGRIIDDVGDQATECTQLIAQNPSIPSQNAGLSALDSCLSNPGNFGIQGSVLINPGKTNNFSVINPAGGFNHFTVSPQQFGFPKVSRRYYALEGFLEHVWDGKWSAKFDYVYSKSYGSTEGPVQSNIGQGGSSGSITEAWDYGQIMDHANGTQANSRKHMFKAFGTYQITPEWRASAIVELASGTPRDCLGFYGPDQTNPGLGYGSYYHWCGGKPAPGGSTGFTPWIHQLSLSAEYRPLWAGKKLAFQVQIHNVLNEQKATQYYPYFGQYFPNGTAGDPTPVYSYASYHRPYYTEAPRYVTLGVTYDW